MSAERVKRSQYFSPPATECPHSSRNHFEDWEEFHLPMTRMHHAALHGRGVATGLAVSVQNGGTQIEVGPGVAIDGKGELIALSAEGQADIGLEGPGETGQQISLPFRLGAAGLENGTHYLCIQFAQALRFTEGSCGKLEQTPWLRLLPTTGDLGPIEAGEAIVLAIVEVNAEGVATVSDGAQGLEHRRQLIRQGTGELRIARTVAAADAVGDASSGTIVAREGGGLRLAVADAADAMILDRADGGRFSSLEVQADDMRVFGNLELKGPLSLGSWGLQAGGSEAAPSLDIQAPADSASVTVRNASGTREVMLGTKEGGGVVSTMTEHDLQLRAGGNKPVMTLKADGRVGIGTAAPGEALEVDGRIKTGCLTVGDWPVQPNHAFFGNNALDQNNPQNYALAQGRAGRTFLNSPQLLDFRTGNSTRMVLANDGKLGIGTISPQGTLHIATGTDVTPGGGGYLVIGPAPAVGPTLALDDNEILARDRGAVSTLHLQSDGGDVWIHSKNVPGTVMIKSDGRVGIGVVEPAFPIHLAGGAHCFGGREWRNASSISCKKDVEDLPLDDALAALRELRPVTFKYIDDDEMRAGFIAEEAPDLVATGDRTSLNAMELVALLARVVQHQQTQIHELSERLYTVARQSRQQS
jgi:Chaperone of endosialidase